MKLVWKLSNQKKKKNELPCIKTMTKLLNGLLDDDQAVTCSCFERYPIYAIFSPVS